MHRLDGLGLSLERIPAREHLRVESPTAGVVDVMRGGLPPLDFESVLESSEAIEVMGRTIPFASLPASWIQAARGRRRDLEDLAALELRWGPLPEPTSALTRRRDPVPGPSRPAARRDPLSAPDSGTIEE